MQIKSSLKQLWVESRANPGFTSLYIGGVAFAVAFTMVYAIVYYVHLAPIYPEYNRNTTAYINNITVRNEKTNSMSMGSPGLIFFRDFVNNSENIEYCTLSYEKPGFIQPPDNSGDFKALCCYTDPNFFKLYGYEFIAGQPFNDAETEAAIKNVVVDRSVAERLFSTPEKAIGKEISFDFENYRIVGVVRNGNPVAYMSYANIFLPYTIYTTINDGGSRGDLTDLLGAFSIPIKFKDSKQESRFRDEIVDKVRRVNAVDSAGWVLDLCSAPVSHTMRVLSQNDNQEDMTIMQFIKPLLIVLLVLLIIPAINISGMISGQMDRRLAEIGVRRGFGATRSELTNQVMFENFVLTSVGGLAGLAVAWILVIIFKNTILQLIVPSWEYIDENVNISLEMIFAPVIFMATLLLCLILNMLSAYIPVRLSLRRTIISAINSKR